MDPARSRPGELSEYFKFSHLSNFNLPLDNTSIVWYNNMGEAKLSDNSELSEYSDVYSIPHFVYKIQYTMQCIQYTNIRSDHVQSEHTFTRVKFYGSQGAASGAAFGRTGAASGSCEGAASIRELGSCISEGAARRKFDKKFQILKNFF